LVLPPSARAVADEVLTVQIRTAFDDNRRVYGAPRIHAELAEAGVRVGRKRVARLMRQAGIVGCHRRKRPFSITRADPRAQAAPGPGRPHVRRDGTQPAVGGRRDLRADGAGLALPRLRHRRVQPAW
jgi:transposase InsO family protein